MYNQRHLHDEEIIEMYTDRKINNLKYNNTNISSNPKEIINYSVFHKECKFQKMRSDKI